MAGREPFRIDVVTVRVAPTLGASSAFADRLSASIIDSSALWNTTGSPKRVALTVKRYHIQRVGRVLVHGEGSLAEARATVIDMTTGRVDANVLVTGIVPHAIGARPVDWSVNRDVEESGIAAALARDLMVKLRGPAAIEVLESRIKTARRYVPDAMDRPQSPEQNPAMPGGARSAWDHGSEMKCIALLEHLFMGGRSIAALPPHCRVLGYRLPDG